MSASVVSPVFVGRQDEIAALTALLDRVQRGEPAFAVIGGEAGVGKTRLLGELAGQAGRAGFTVLVGHCIELGAEGLPFAPLVDALRALTRAIPADELARVVGPAAPGLARLLPELSPDAAARLPADGIQSAQLLELVLGLLGLAQRRPAGHARAGGPALGGPVHPGAGRLPGPLAARGPGAAGRHLPVRRAAPAPSAAAAAHRLGAGPDRGPRRADPVPARRGRRPAGRDPGRRAAARPGRSGLRPVRRQRLPGGGARRGGPPRRRPGRPAPVAGSTSC